jgi:predicted DsbA family dithiol-disulfide isomerase
MSKPLLQVQVFSDYICPFCYIGSVRLLKLNEFFDLKVHWCFVEIHPGTPVEGMSVEKLDYSAEQWQELTVSLSRLAKQDNIDIKERGFTTNSHRALLLAESAKEEGRDIFYQVHDSLFKAFFSEQQNIADWTILTKIGLDSGMSQASIDRALDNPSYENTLRKNLKLATENKVTGVPAYIIGDEKIYGVASDEKLLVTARNYISNHP